ncbi:DUF2218 domain-containing protein [Pseudophaeobacter sp.]|uniref:DUF2218 domain-containing protein n=1 Tax=Pseudophaeobacter sp. TaxID=1971739 RepID=UPI003299C17B
MLVANPSQGGMSKTEAEFRSDRSGGYRATMASHFSRKIEVTEVDGAVHLQFICGLAVLRVTADTLHIRIEAPSKEEMQQTCQVVESHLLRFAFREEPTPLIWRDL